MKIVLSGILLWFVCITSCSKCDQADESSSDALIRNESKTQLMPRVSIVQQNQEVDSISSTNTLYAVKGFNDLLEGLTAATETNRKATALLLAAADVPYFDKLIKIKNMYVNVTNISEIEQVYTSFFAHTDTLVQKHRAAMDLSYLMARNKLYDKGIEMLETILLEQEQSGTSDEGTVMATHQRLAAMNMMDHKFQKELEHASIAYDMALKTEHKGYILGTQSDLACALANNGKFIEAKHVTEELLRSNDSSTYKELLDNINFYIKHPERRDPEKPVYIFYY